LLEFRALEAFHSVATLKSFGRAAEALHMTQSAVSQRIAKLEADLGARLLERTTKGPVLTLKGQILLMYADRLLRTRTELVQAIADPRATSRSIRLGVAETIAQTWLPALISSASAQFPFVTFDIETDVTTNLRARLLRQELDLAFLLGAVIEPGFTSLELCSYQLAFVASTKLGLGPRPVSLSAIGSFPLISFTRSTNLYSAMQALFQQHALPMPRIYSSSSISTIIKMTLDGIGVSVITPEAVRPELREGKLVVLDAGVALPSLDYSASYGSPSSGGLVATIAQIAVSMAAEWAAAD
jgi:DNA-binding transcriptional LysR family regulator